MSVPGSHCAPFASVQTAHVPEPPHAVAWLPVTQEPIEQHVPAPQVPLPAPPQAAVHALPTHDGVAPEHGPQACPLPPQAVFTLPAVHIPPLQQPPLHPVSLVPRHAVPHACVIVLQACPAPRPTAGAHSAAVSHPQVSVPGSQLVPFALPMQLAQVPDPPQAVC